MTVLRREFLPGSERQSRSQSRTDTKGEGKRSVALRMPGAGLNSATDRKASPERVSLEAVPGKTRRTEF